MKHTFNLVAMVALVFGAIQAQGQSVTFDFQDGTDQGFGTGFGDDASKIFPIVNIGGSLRMEVILGGFQVAGRQGTTDPFLGAMNAATAAPGAYLISYDWYIDTSLGSQGNFLQLGTYINSGSGANTQDFPASPFKDVELNGTQLASGGVFSGTVSETLTAKYGAPLNAGHLAQGLQRLGLIMNGDGAGVKMYFDNISVSPIPEPASLSLLGLAATALWMMRRRRSAHR